MGRFVSFEDQYREVWKGMAYWIQWMREEDGFVSPFCQRRLKKLFYSEFQDFQICQGALENLSTQGADVESVLFVQIRTILMLLMILEDLCGRWEKDQFHWMMNN